MSLPLMTAALLEHLSLFEEKTIPAIFRESKRSCT